MSNGIRTRQNVAGMTSDHPTLAAYRTAVREMKNLPESDPRNWRRQAQIHQNNCPHWNWTRTRSIPAPFWEGTLRDTTKAIGPNAEISGQFVGRSVIDGILRQTNFELFGSFRPQGQNSTDPSWQRAGGASAELEARPHDQVHVWVNGNMVTFMSPLDPIFWLHHCNIDRLWAEWNAGGRANTSSSLWRDFTLRPFNTLVRDLQSITQLGYTYSSLAQTRLAEPTEAPPLLERARESFELMEPQVASLGQEVSFSVETPQRALPLPAEA